MTRLDPQFLEDRALRDASKAVLTADIEHARATFSAKGVATRVAGTIGDGAKDSYEVAKVHADDNRGIIAGLIGAILLWLAHEPILEILGLADTPENDPETPADEQDAATAPSSEAEPVADPSGENDEH